MKRIYVAATGQNVGKTAVSLGLLSGLKKRFSRVGFIKPVGQEHVQLGKTLVDKDVALFHSYFGLKESPKIMSPVLFPSGLTRDVLDGKIQTKVLERQICEAMHVMEKHCDVCVIEGTGHLRVGSVAGLSCARVAKLLNAPVITVAGGGIGKTIDRLALAQALLTQEGAQVNGVLLNQVLDEKREQTINYIQKGLKPWKWPLIGAVPFSPFLSTPTMSDYAALFKVPLIAGKGQKLRHFSHRLLAAGPLSLIEKQLKESQLIIAGSSREDLITYLYTHKKESSLGLILTGKTHPNRDILELIEALDLPTLYIDAPSYFALEKITSFVTKFSPEDTAKIDAAIEVIEPHIDFERLWN